MLQIDSLVSKGAFLEQIQKRKTMQFILMKLTDIFHKSSIIFLIFWLQKLKRITQIKVEI
jgi:hypothetical protein